MDHLRMQSENVFLAFLPNDRREEIRASWYVGATHKRSYRIIDDMGSMGHGTQVRYTRADVKAELLERILAHTPPFAGSSDPLNRCAAPPCDRPGAPALEQKVERVLQTLTTVRAPFVQHLPDVVLLRVHSDGLTETAAYTLIHDRAHTNVASLFLEDERLLPEDDTLTVVRGYLGSYPNFAFDVPAAEIGEFGKTLAAVSEPAGFEAIARRWGVRRTSRRFWTFFDWAHDDFRRHQPTEAGVFDLNRYKNH
jgi:hypothetical protein